MVISEKKHVTCNPELSDELNFPEFKKEIENMITIFTMKWDWHSMNLRVFSIAAKTFKWNGWIN